MLNRPRTRSRERARDREKGREWEREGGRGGRGRKRAQCDDAPGLFLLRNTRYRAMQTPYVSATCACVCVRLYARVCVHAVYSRARGILPRGRDLQAEALYISEFGEANETYTFARVSFGPFPFELIYPRYTFEDTLTKRFALSICLRVRCKSRIHERSTLLRILHLFRTFSHYIYTVSFLLFFDRLRCREFGGRISSERERQKGNSSE